MFQCPLGYKIQICQGGPGFFIGAKDGKEIKCKLTLFTSTPTKARHLTVSEEFLAIYDTGCTGECFREGTDV